MGGKKVFWFLAAIAASFLIFVTAPFKDIGVLIEKTFSPAATLIVTMPIATSTKTAALAFNTAAKPKPKPKSNPAPVVSVTSPIPSVAGPSVVTPPPPASPPASQAASAPASVPVVAPSESAGARVLVSEIMVGTDGNAKYEFIEIYNPTSGAVDLTGYSVRKKSSTGSESSLVAASRLSGKWIQPNRYFLIAGSGGYDGAVPADVLWPASYSLAAKKNSVVVYNGKGEKVEEVSWEEIPAGDSLVRSNWSGNRFDLSATPTPQNSQSL